VHCTGQGDKIKKKRIYIFIVGFLIGCTAVIVYDFIAGLFAGHLGLDERKYFK